MKRRLGTLAPLLIVCGSIACGSKDKGSDNQLGNAVSDPGQAGAAGQSTGGGGTSGAADNTDVSGATNGGNGGMAGEVNGADAGTAGSAGAAGSAGTGGSPLVDGGVDQDAGFTDPGTENDGDFVLAQGHPSDPANASTGAPQGQLITFQMLSSESTIYTGIRGPYTRNVWVYVPAQYVPGTPAPVMVVQDGGFAVWFGDNVPHTRQTAPPNLPGTANIPTILDNLIQAGDVPKLVAIFVDNGGGDAEGSERGLEYDTVSGKYAEFVQTEVFPRAEAEVQTQLNLALTITSDPRGRATLGGSSGGAAAFSMAWWHPDLFTRVISYSGTFVRQASPEDPLYPHGCWCYHDFDPYDATMPNGLIMREDTAKPLRVWLEAAQNDNGAGSGAGSYRDFKLANDRMAASFAAKGYHYHYDYAQGAGHFDGGVIAQTLPGALRWLWAGYPKD